MPRTTLTAVVIHEGGTTVTPLENEARGRWVIGRTRDADLVIDDATVSRRHAVLYAGEAFELEDLGSENGTTVVRYDPGAIVDETLRLMPRRLQAGERVPIEGFVHAQLGRVTLLLQPGTPGATWQGPPPEHPTAVPPGVVIASPAMKRVYWLAERFAQGEINLLLLGETGVGKEVLAEHIHRASPRRAGPFLRLNCASLRGDLLESELFGHERGAFTGAVAAKRGLVEAAAGGTLFLDEVGEIPLDIQARLLRFLEDRRALRIGGTEARHVDVRIVSATNRNLADEAAAGRFRSDLYFRLNGVALEIPPLRLRPEEVVPLAEHFLHVHAATLGLAAPPRFDAGTLQLLRRAPLLGNVRELRNLIERAMLLVEAGQAIRAEHLMLEPAAANPAPPAPAIAAPRTVDDEEARVVAALERCGGNQTRAARELGLTRKALIVRLVRYGINRPRS